MLQRGAWRASSRALLPSLPKSGQTFRPFSSSSGQKGRSGDSSSSFSFSPLLKGAALASVLALSASFLTQQEPSFSASSTGLPAPSKVDYEQVRKAIVDLLDDLDYDDGSRGPLFVRLAWHASGTFSKLDSTGGSNGGCMRFQPEASWGANNGLQLARDILEPVYRKFPGLTHADLYTLAGVVSIQELGGPIVRWRPGRDDFLDGKTSPPDGRLPDAAQGAQHVRDIFYRMGFDDKQIVCLIGAHALGRCHTDRSGYSGPWTRSPTSFSNDFFTTLLNEKWRVKQWDGPKQYENEADGSLMMLPADMALIEDPKFKKYVEYYAKDQDAFFKDFADNFATLLELGVKFQAEDGKLEPKRAPEPQKQIEAAKPWYKKLF